MYGHSSADCRLPYTWQMPLIALSYSNWQERGMQYFSLRQHKQLLKTKQKKNHTRSLKAMDACGIAGVWTSRDTNTQKYPF